MWGLPAWAGGWVLGGNGLRPKLAAWEGKAAPALRGRTTTPLDPLGKLVDCLPTWNFWTTHLSRPDGPGSSRDKGPITGLFRPSSRSRSPVSGAGQCQPKIGAHRAATRNQTAFLAA